MAAVVVPLTRWGPGNPINYLVGIGDYAWTAYNSGNGYRINYNNTWAINQVGPNSVMFEVRSGDTNWYDTGSGKERSEVSSNQLIPNGTPIHVSYDYVMEPGPKNSGAWVITGQFHTTNEGLPPPFDIEFKGDKMDITIRYMDPNGRQITKILYVDPTNIVRGQSYHFDVYAVFNDDSSGRLEVARNGRVLADYSGPLGSGTAGTSTAGTNYWQYGIYRYHAAETLDVQYSNLTIDSGAAVQVPASGLSTVSLSPAPTLSLAAITAINTGASVVLSGTATANTTVEIFDGTALAGSTTAAGDGSYVTSVAVGVGSHLFKTAVLDASGNLSRTSTDLPIEVDTSANIMARMNYISAENGLGAIELMDTHTLAFAKVSDMQSLIAAGAKALSVIDGGYNFSVQTSSTNTTVNSIYNAAGQLEDSYQTSTTGSSTNLIIHKIYNNGTYTGMEYGIFHIVAQEYTSAYRQFNISNQQIAIVQYHADDTLQYAGFRHADGSTDARYYDVSGNILSNSYTAPDGTISTRQYVYGIPVDYTTHTDGMVTPGVSDPSVFDADQLPNMNAGTAAGQDGTSAHQGDDVYMIMNQGMQINEAPHGGNDIVYTTLTNYVLPENVEQLNYTGTLAAQLTGNALANVITGGAGNDMLDGSTGADTLIGGQGDDTYIVHDGAATILENSGEGTDTVRTDLASYTLGANLENLAYISTGNAVLTGNALANVITGGAGNDMLDGSTGADTLIGGQGDDTYIVHDGAATILENSGEGTDTVRTDLASYTLGANLENLAYISTGNAVLTGNALANVITGGAGNDMLDGSTGADTLIGGQGDDTYIVHDGAATILENSGEGTDTVRTDLASYTLGANLENLAYISTGNAVLTGNALANVITGGAGNDMLDGSTGADTLIGGQGDDTYIVHDGAATILENSGEGTDTVRTDLASYTLGANLENLAYISTGNAVLTGNALANVITGGAGNDMLDGSTGADTLIGGQGDDTYIVHDGAATILENSGEGTDTVRTDLASYTLGANLENLAYISTGNAVLTGNALANVITGGAGNDMLDGSTGADTLIGGQGDDTYIVHDGAATILENSGEGTDTVRTDLASYTLGANLENLAYISTGNAVLTGNALANVITGGAGNDMLNGGAGADTLIGAQGNDTYIVNHVDDTIIEAPNGGTDKVASTISFMLPDNVESLQLSGTAAINATGNALDNQLTGNDAANYINGGTGADRMEGRGGDDTYVVDNVNDKVIEAANGGTDTVFSSVTYGLGSNIENMSLTGAASIGGTGNTLDNFLSGNSAINSLNGMAGNDTLDGGFGSDTLTGGTGSDNFVFSTALGSKNIDSITDFFPDADKIQISSAIFSGLGSGTLTADTFKDLSVSSEDSTHAMILYDPKTGALSFDPDGTGPANAVQFALLINHAAIHPGDIVVI